MGIKEMVQAIATFIHLGDGCYCTLATAEIRLDEGRFTAIIRNGADGVYSTHVYVVDQFGSQFNCATTHEPNSDYEVPYSVSTLASFSEFNEFTVNMYGCTYDDLCDSDLSWFEILSNFYDVSMSPDLIIAMKIDSADGNQQLANDVITIAELLSAALRWN